MTYLYGTPTPEQRAIIAKINRGSAWQRRKMAGATIAHTPRFLYKYMSLDWKNPDSWRNTRTVIVDSNLWLSSPPEFNDPFDFRAKFVLNSDPVEMRKQILRSAQRTARSLGQKRKVAQQWAKRTTANAVRDPDLATKSWNRSIETFGVSCLSRNPRHVLMWAHYGQSHTGICFQFETSLEMEVFGLALPVEYSESFPVLEWPLDKEDVFKVILRKSRLWEYEEEMRIVLPRLDSRAVPLPGKCLRGIILGARIKDDQLNMVSTLLHERTTRGLPPVKIYRTSASPSDYRMRITRFELP